MERERDRLRGRMREPLRIAVAGRVKAGKSTLLNALVGEKLAPTDAGECTRVVAWYADGPTYSVHCRGRDGSREEVHFRRDGGALDIDLGGIALDSIDRLEVTWPSASLRAATLIDTPGLASLDDTNSVRTRDFLAVDDDRPSDADVVIYLMRHLHRHDADFLDSFYDHSLANASPVNAVAVISRADEIGAGRLDAMESARRIAARYAADERMHSLCMGVVAVAGLVAETGLTLTEGEAATLRTLAALPDEELGGLLLSADRFVAPGLGPLAPEIRRELLDRLGLFGVRFCTRKIRSGEATTAVALARALVEVSGLDELRAVLREHFVPRAVALQARSVLAGLRAIGRRLRATAPAAAERIDAEVEQFESAAHELAELRLVHLVMAGMVRLSPDEVTEVRRVIGPGDSAARLGLGSTPEPGAARSAALAGIERWRTKAAVPFVDPAGREACDILTRTYEGLFTSAST